MRTKAKAVKAKVLSKKKIKDLRYFTEWGAHLGIGGNLLASVLNSHETLRAKAIPPKRKRKP